MNLQIQLYNIEILPDNVIQNLWKAHVSLYGYSGICVMAPPPLCSQSPPHRGLVTKCGSYISEQANLSLLYVRESVNISSLAAFSLSSLLTALTPGRLHLPQFKKTMSQHQIR